MEGRTTVLQRPMGPRSINRSSPSLVLQNTSDSRRPFSPPSLTISTPPIQPEPSRAVAPQPPSLTLSIPRPLNSKPSAPKIKLQLNTTANAGPLFEGYASGPGGLDPRPSNPKPSAPKIKLQINTGANSGPLFESYAGGPGGLDPQPANLTEERTIRPESLTMVPTHKQADAFGNLRDLVTELEAIRTGPQSVPRDSIYSKDLSDDVFEELSHLGEGAGGGVHKVRNKRTGMIMARKTITTLEAPRRQLERELSIAATANHPNIIKWYGVYMSPSSSEIKILMEYCEGRSLDAVGRQMKELGAVVGEKIYGRLAEGVRQSICISLPQLTLK